VRLAGLGPAGYGYVAGGHQPALPVFLEDGSLLADNQTTQC